MRKVKKEKQLVEKEVVVSNQVFCDWCENEFKYHNMSWEPLNEWIQEYQDITTEIEIKVTVSHSYYEWLGCMGFEIQDLCPNCVVKLKQLLIEAGIKVREINL